MLDPKFLSHYASELQTHRTTAFTFVQDRPVSTALMLTGAIFLVGPPALGFTTSGPAAGSTAAAWQASIGNVAAHSLFAGMQSATMKGTLLMAGGSMVGMGMVGMITDADRKAAEWIRSAQAKGWEETVRGVEWERVMRDAEMGAVRGAEWVKGEAAKQAGWAREEVARRGPEWVEKAGEMASGAAKGIREEVERRGPGWAEKAGEMVGGAARGAGWAAEVAAKEFGKGFRRAFDDGAKGGD
ncbi:hypothetical protein DFP73DRAFT_621662 [Morchella snyderi]|nr:hypothetical protein DFP73DRAFT_621662 [Morchella snyderi]